MSNPERPAPSRTGLVSAFAAIYVIWGSTYLAIRIGIETLPPFLMAGFRFLLAGLPLYLWVRARGARRPDPAHWRSALIVGTLMLAGGNGLVTWAEQYVASGLAAVLVATVPLWMTVLAAWPFGGARPSGLSWIGLVVGIVGVAVLVSPTGTEVRAVHPVGGALLVVAALSWSFGSLLTRSLPLPSSPLTAVAMQMTAGGAMLIVWGTVAGEWSALDLAAVSSRSILALLYLVSVGSIVALGAYVWLMRNVSATAVSTYAFVNPMVAVLLGWTLAGETLDARTGAAAVLIVCAVVILHGSRARFGRARRPVGPEPPAEAERVEMPERRRCKSA